MTVAIMQPYFFPYIGYFQLISAVDTFVVYDNIEFTKKGWINRNRVLVNNTDAYITLPIKNDSDYLTVADRFLAESWVADKNKMLNRIKESYRKSPFFTQAFPLIEQIILFSDSNLFGFIFNSLRSVAEYLSISTPFHISSSISIDHTLKSQDKVIEICKKIGAKHYLNPIGGLELYNNETFKKEGIDLSFLKTGEVKYQQFNNDFVPHLSIIDVMMFNSVDRIKEYLVRDFRLIKN